MFTRRRKRATNTVVANTELTIEHARTVSAVDLTTFVNTKTATTLFTDTWGFTASDAEITTDNTSKFNTAIIAGVTVAAVAGVGGTAFLAWLFWRRRGYSQTLKD